MIFLGQNKTETMVMIFFDTKHRYTDISWFDGGNPDFYLHCFGIFYVHVQVSKYKMSLYFYDILGCLKISWTGAPPPVCVCAECPPGTFSVKMCYF